MWVWLANPPFRSGPVTLQGQVELKVLDIDNGELLNRRGTEKLRIRVQQLKKSHKRSSSYYPYWLVDIHLLQSVG